jgi:cytochrome d ubiquinol oxidase subunit I
MVLFVAALTSILQPISGDLNARRLHELQPSKLAAMEGQFESQECAPLRIGGVPSLAEQRTRFALEIPCGLSLMVAHDPRARVLGLDAFPEHERPDPRPVHLAFQLMVGIGSALALLGVVAAWVAWKHGARIAEHRRLLWLLVAAAPLGFVAIEAGWVVTEVGRQPWIIFGVMRVEEALTPMPGIAFSLALYTAIYVGLTVIVVQLMRRQVRGVAALRDGHS